MTGFDRKMIRRYLRQPAATPEYGPRPKAPSLLDPFKPYLHDRLSTGMWNARVLLRELRECSHKAATRFQPSGCVRSTKRRARLRCGDSKRQQANRAKVDRGHLRRTAIDGKEQKLWGFTLTLGHSRMLMASAAVHQKLATLLRMHEEVFRQLGGVPKQVLYEPMRKVGHVDERGKIVWNPVFLDFARYWRLTPRLCLPGADQGQSRKRSEVCAAQLLVRVGPASR